MSKYNLLVKRNENVPAYLVDLKSAIATNLSKKSFERIKELNQELLKDYDFMPYSDVDCSWWYKVDKFLTSKKLRYSQGFDCDLWGNVVRF